MSYLWLLLTLLFGVVRSATSANYSRTCTTQISAFIKSTVFTAPLAKGTSYTSVFTVNRRAPTSTSTHYRSTATVRTRSTIVATRYVTEAPKTTTIPTSDGWLPIASLNGTHPFPRTKKLTYIQCYDIAYANTTTTVVHYPFTTVSNTGVSTTTTTAYVFATTTSTISTSLATRYAGCEDPNNYISKYKKRKINFVTSINTRRQFPKLPKGQRYLAADQSPQDCCDAVFAWGNPQISGFRYDGSYNGYENLCRPMGATKPNDLNGWQFFTAGSGSGSMGAGPMDPDLYIYGGDCGSGDPTYDWTCTVYNQDYKYY